MEEIKGEDQKLEECPKRIKRLSKQQIRMKERQGWLLEQIYYFNYECDFTASMIAKRLRLPYKRVLKIINS